MGTARAHVYDGRITVRTSGDFEEMLASSKAVPGGRWDDVARWWHYPLSIDTCHALRTAFGAALVVGTDLASWYRAARQAADQHTQTARATDAPLPTLARSHPAFHGWLRPAQRAGARWTAEGYRGAGLNGDHPGLGKTTETLAGLVEAGVTGPVLVLCPKVSVRLVWGHELATHLPEVPVYLCYGKRARRTRVLRQFAADLARDPHRLRIVVVVAEMLRVQLGDPCYTPSGHRVSGMCPQRFRTEDQSCTRHAVMRDARAEEKSPQQRKKDQVPVGFSYPELFDTEGLGGGWSALVVDESQKLMGSLTIVKGNLMGRGLRLLPERAKRRHALSGTPFGKAGRVEGLFGTLHWLWPDEHTSFWKWANRIFDFEEDEYHVAGGRGRTRVTRKIVGLKGLRANSSLAEESAAAEEFLASLGPRLLRRTKAEVLPNLKPKRYVSVECAMTPAQRRQYEELVQWGEVTTPGGPLVANGVLPLLTRSRQIANGAVTMDGSTLRFQADGGKLERLELALETRGILDNVVGPKLIVASAFNEYLDMLAAWLAGRGVPYLAFDGRLSQRRRDGVVERWQAGPLGGRTEPRVLLLNAQAGGLSITLDMADEMHVMDELPDPGANEQLEDRIHRASRDHQVTIFTYRTEGTIDYKRAANVEFRRRAQHAVLDGARGLKDVRALLTEAFANSTEEEE